MIVQFCRSHIQGNPDIFSRPVARALHRLHDEAQRLLRIRQIRGESALVTYGCTVSVLLQQALQRMVDLRTHPKTFFEAARSHRHDHEFLDIYGVVRMSASVHDIHHRHRQTLRVRSPKIRVQRNTKCAGGCTGGCHGDAQHGIGSKIRFVPRSVKLLHDPVYHGLIEHIDPYNRRRDLRIHMINRKLHSKTAVPRLLIPQFQCFILAGRRTRRNTCPSKMSLSCQHFYFYGRIPAGI